MAINIGDGNKIKNSTISDNSVINNKSKEKKSWAEKHPILIGVIIAIVAGVILELAFWDEIIQAINMILGV